MAMQYIVEEVSSLQQPAPMDPLLQQVRLKGLGGPAGAGGDGPGSTLDIVARIEPKKLPDPQRFEGPPSDRKLAAGADWTFTLRSKIGPCSPPEQGYIVTARLWVRSEQAIDQVRRAGGEAGWLRSLKLAPRARPQLHRTIPLVLGDLLEENGQGQPLTSRKLTGRGVVVGVVDYGCDFASPAFRVPESGETRLLCLWDQNGSDNESGRSPASFGYGREYRRDDIDRVLNKVRYDNQVGYDWAQAVRDFNDPAPRNAPNAALQALYKELGYDPGDNAFSTHYAPPPKFFGANTDPALFTTGSGGGGEAQSDDPFDAIALHGTHVLDIAAGTPFHRSFRLFSTLDPSSRITGGVAPEADLIFVQICKSSWKGVGDFTASSHILDAVKYILDEANALGGDGPGPRPVVVNLSLNAYAGPHDGLTLLEMGLDAMARERQNTAIVISAANNQRSIREHRVLQAKPTAAAADGDGAAQLVWRLGEKPRETADSLHEIEIWYPEELPVPKDNPLPSFRLGFFPQGGPHATIRSRAGAEELQVGKVYSIKQVANGGQEETIGEVFSRYGDPNNEKGTINIVLREAVEAREWSMEFGPTEKHCTLHAWIEYNQENQSSFVGGGEKDDNNTLGSICGTRHCVIVGSSACELPDWWGNLSPSEFTSRGPVLPVAGPGEPLPLEKPDLLGPGEGAFRRTISGQKVNMVAAAGRYGGGPVLMQGTSQATPHVTGAIALLLQRATAVGKALSSDDILKLLHKSCRSASGKWNPREGYGLLDIDALIKLV